MYTNTESHPVSNDTVDSQHNIGISEGKQNKKQTIVPTQSKSKPASSSSANNTLQKIVAGAVVGVAAAGIVAALVCIGKALASLFSSGPEMELTGTEELILASA